MLARAGEGLLAMVGGVPGIAVAAAGALIYMATSENDLEKQTDKLIETTKNLNFTLAAGVAPPVQDAQEQYDQL
jgi:hypothetical protein